MTEQFKPGDEVFDQNGNIGEYVAHLDGSYVVVPYLRDSDTCDIFRGIPEIWRTVYGAAPRPMVDKAVQAMHKQIADLRSEISKLYVERNTLAQTQERVLAELKKGPGLADVDLWMQGKMTHALVIDRYNGYSISLLSTLLESGEGYSKEIRLVSLYGGSPGRYPSVKMASYSDGSGSITPIIGATSPEDAAAKAQVHFDGELARVARHGREHGFMALARSAVSFGLTVPDNIRVEVEKDANERAAAIQKKRRADLDSAIKRVEALRRELGE